VAFGDQAFQQSVGIPMSITLAPLLADLTLYSYEAEFVQELIRNEIKQFTVSFSNTLYMSMY
jgi:hypothetical protein